MQTSVDRGAKLILGSADGGQPPEGFARANSRAAWFRPAILVGAPPNSPARDEELFGPVASVLPVENEREAIEVANSTRFGLGSAVFSSDTAHAAKLIEEELDVGMGFVNDFCRSDSRYPFGGTKCSGVGRESGVHGLRELCYAKTVSIPGP